MSALPSVVTHNDAMGGRTGTSRMKKHTYHVHIKIDRHNGRSEVSGYVFAQNMLLAYYEAVRLLAEHDIDEEHQSVDINIKIVK